jgi:hypothetical protein
VISATALANKQQQSQPSTAYPYSNANFSIDVGASPSTPASSHADLLSPFTQDMGYCRCNTYGCDRPHRITQEIHLRHHQEIKHVDLRHPIVTYPCPVACGVKPFRKPAYRHNHIKCNHPELLPSPTQLLPSNVSECDTQPDKLAHVREFLAEEYLLGIEDNPIAIPDQRAPGEIDPLTVLNWRQQRSSRRAHQQRVYGEPRIRRSNSPMQSQLSAKTANNHTDELLGQFRSTSSNHGNGFTATNSNASFQWSALRGQQTMEVMSNVSGQHRMLRSHSQHTNSPTPSLVGQFADNMQISDQLRLFPSSSDIGEDVPGLPMQQDHLGMYMTTNTVPIPTSVALHRNWDLQNQSTNSFNPQSFNAYENLGCTPTEVSFQPENNGSDMSVPWSRQGPETSMAQADGFSSGLAHPGFQSDTQDTHYLVNHGSSLRFPIPPSAAKHPMITLNDGTMLHTGEDADLIFAPNTFNSDPIPSQRSSIPYLYYSTLSSSGASDSIVSPVDAPNPFSDKFGEDLDGSSSFFNGFNNMEVVRRPSFLGLKNLRLTLCYLQSTND